MKKIISVAMALSLMLCGGVAFGQGAAHGAKGGRKGSKANDFPRKEMTKPGSKQVDWAGFACYESQNEALLHAEGKYVRPFAVLMGDSITWAWYEDDRDFFTSNNMIGRGISGQTTSEMLVRFRSDVIDLHPKYAVIMAGTNDLAHNNGEITIDNIFRNIVSMAELARSAKIKPVLCSVPPVDVFGWRPELGNRSADVIKLNAMIEAYAKAHKYIYLDYHKVLKDEKNALRKDYGKDAVHPNIKGYKEMEAVFLKALKK